MGSTRSGVSPDIGTFGFEAEYDYYSQGTNSKGTSEVGSLPQIPRQITTSPAETTLKELPHGSLKATSLGNGQK